jgi:pimeloyl-ACP methyl ester carboxylesterase
MIALLLVACSGTDQLEQINLNEAITERVSQTQINDTTLELPGYQLHYVSSSQTLTDANNSNKQTQTLVKDSLVFVHGTPGDWGTFSRYFEDSTLLSAFNVNSIDRPGWGNSSYPGKRFPTSLSSQSALLGPLLEDIWRKNNEQKVILVGHSLGGSLVPKLAADYPHFVKAIVILAGDLDPDMAEARWFNDILSYLPNFMIPDMWANSNAEVLAIAPSLANLQSQFAKITMPITVVQGTEDDLVRPGSAAMAQKIFPKAKLNTVWLEGAGHIINMTHQNDVSAAIFKIAGKEVPHTIL